MYDKICFDSSRDDALSVNLQDSIFKAVYMIQKYADHESGVDCFVQLLLNRIGFFDDWLYVFPQLRLKLIYGGGTVKEAIPDFTVIDVVSFLRMAVMEDKRYNDAIVNSEPQLIAELIAMIQSNLPVGPKVAQLSSTETAEISPEEQPVIGVRVSGLNFHFYRIENSEHLLHAMARNTAANEVINSSLLY